MEAARVTHPLYPLTVVIQIQVGANYWLYIVDLTA